MTRYLLAPLIVIALALAAAVYIQNLRIDTLRLEADRLRASVENLSISLAEAKRAQTIAADVSRAGDVLRRETNAATNQLIQGGAGETPVPDDVRRYLGVRD